MTGDELYRRVAIETLDYVLREMTWRGADEEGRELLGFFSSQDADSRNAAGELEEGAFFTWAPEEIEEILAGAVRAADDGSRLGDDPDEGAAAPFSPADVRLFTESYGVTQHGNFEGRTILHGRSTPTWWPNGTGSRWARSSGG